MSMPASFNPVFSKTALKDRRILVTGASSGIGANAAKLFSSLGADVILVGRNNENLESVSRDLSNTKFLVKVVDLSVPDLIYHEIKAFPSEWLPLHGVLHASGNELVRPIQLIKSTEFDCLMSASAKAALGIARAIASKGVMCDGGAFVLISSVAAITGTSGLSLYSATKGAIEAITRSLAVELAPKSIRVNAITAGAVETPMHHRLLSSMPEKAVQDYESKHPLGFGQPIDISNLAAFLMTDAGRWVTGASLVIDGGYSAL
jgi:NAD(P)-dependent dehydrogenase (short-subunit alcohol dehydrogenase family)